MSRRTVKSVKLSCDRTWSQLVRSRAGWECERCGATPEDGRGFHAHHVYGRNNHRLRWEPMNGVAYCARCHRWAHDNPLAFSAWFWDVRNHDALSLRDEHQRGTLKRNLEDYLELEASLKLLLASTNH